MAMVIGLPQPPFSEEPLFSFNRNESPWNPFDEQVTKLENSYDSDVQNLSDKDKENFKKHCHYLIGRIQGKIKEMQWLRLPFRQIKAEVDKEIADFHRSAGEFLRKCDSYEQSKIKIDESIKALETKISSSSVNFSPFLSKRRSAAQSPEDIDIVERVSNKILTDMLIQTPPANKESRKMEFDIGQFKFTEIVSTFESGSQWIVSELGIEEISSPDASIEEKTTKLFQIHSKVKVPEPPEFLKYIDGFLETAERGGKVLQHPRQEYYSINGASSQETIIGMMMAASLTKTIAKGISIPFNKYAMGIFRSIQGLELNQTIVMSESLMISQPASKKNTLYTHLIDLSGSDFLRDTFRTLITSKDQAIASLENMMRSIVNHTARGLNEAYDIPPEMTRQFYKDIFFSVEKATQYYGAYKLTGIARMGIDTLKSQPNINISDTGHAFSLSLRLSGLMTLPFIRTIPIDAPGADPFLPLLQPLRFDKSDADSSLKLDNH